MFLPLLAAMAIPQAKPSKEGQAVLKSLMTVRSLPARQRAVRITDIARTIGAIKTGNEKVLLASMLVGLCTEGNIGHPAIQLAADTLSHALQQAPPDPKSTDPTALYPYSELADLQRYEGVRVRLHTPAYEKALQTVDDTLAARSKADFVLRDLQGRTWRRTALNGKVVLLNFWATWCPPCRKEMPELEALYERYRSQGFIVLAVSDEAPAKVKAFADAQKWTFPVLLDPGDVVEKEYRLESIPKSFVYDRSGKLVATAIDRRTHQQFMRLLAKAHLK